MDAVQKALRIAKEDGGPSVGANAPATDIAPAIEAEAAGPDYAAFVTNLYQSQLGRGPDPIGLKNWVDALQSGRATQQDVYKGFALSPEKQSLNAPKYEDYIKDLYREELNRAPDPIGLQDWMSALQSGNATAEQVRQGILGSPEYASLNAPPGSSGGGNSVDITQGGMPLIYKPQPYKDYGATASAYRVASELENLPSPFYTLSSVVGGTPSGNDAQPTQPTQPEQPKPPSYENILNQLNDTTLRPIISQAYKDYLNREAAPSEIDNWIKTAQESKLSANELLPYIVNSPEANILATKNIVANAYKQYLGREASPEELENWAASAAQQSLTPQQLIPYISGSEEAKMRGFEDGGAVHGYADGGGAGDLYDDLINSAYRDFMGRDPSQQDFNKWMSALSEGKIEPWQLESKIKGLGYEDNIYKGYMDILNRTPDPAGVKSWGDLFASGKLTDAQFRQQLANSPEYKLKQMVPASDLTSERQGGRGYNIDIGNVERMPELGRVSGPMNIKEAFENSEIARLQRELEAAKLSGSGSSWRDSGGGGGNGGGGDGTSGGLGDTAGGGGYGSAPGNSDSADGSPAGDGGGTAGGATGDGFAHGGMIGNNAINNALRMIKADRR